MSEVWIYQHLLYIEGRLTTIISLLNTLITKENKMAVNLDALTNEVTQNSNVTQSVVALVNNLAELIKAIPPSSDPATQAALDQLVATLNANDSTLAAAVTANTPAP